MVLRGTKVWKEIMTVLPDLVSEVLSQGQTLGRERLLEDFRILKINLYYTWCGSSLCMIGGIVMVILTFKTSRFGSLFSPYTLDDIRKLQCSLADPPRFF